MDLEKIKELKDLLDIEALSQDEFSNLKKKIINEEEVSLDTYWTRMYRSDLKFEIEKFGILPESLIIISVNFHEQKGLGMFSMKKEKLKVKAQDFKKAHKIGFLDWGNFILIMESLPVINSDNISLFYDENVKLGQTKNNDVKDSSFKQGAPSLVSVKKSLTQPKSRKYSGYSNVNLSDISNEVESFYSNQKFGWLGEAKPTVIVDNNKNGVVIRCYTAKTLIKTWGNSSETAINVTIEKNNGTIDFNCGFTGNKSVLSAGSIAGAVFTGGVSLVGNAASAVKDGKLISSSMQFIDDMMRNQFQNDESAGPVQQTHQVVDIPAQIRKLSALKDDGILTEEEFNSKKSELLSKI